MPRRKSGSIATPTNGESSPKSERNNDSGAPSVFGLHSQSEEYVRLVADTVPALISYVDRDHRYRFNNKLFSEWLGYSEGELTGQHVRTVLGDDGYQKLLPLIEQALRGESPQYETVLTHRGVPRRLRGQYTPDFDEEGQVRGFVALVQDVTEIRRKEEELAESDRILRSFYASAPIMMSVVEIDGDDIIYLNCNEAAARDIGLTAETARMRSLSSLGIAKDRIAYYIAEYRKAEHSETPLNLEIKRRENEWLSVRVGWIGEGPTGNPRFSIVYEDITEKRAAQESLRLSERRFRMLVEQSPISTQIIEAPSGRTLQVNQAFVDLFGITLEGLADYNILHDPLLEQAGILSLIHRAFAGESIELPMIPYAPDRGKLKGQTTWTKASIYPVTREDGIVSEVVLMHQDLTKLMIAQIELERANKRFEIAAEVVQGMVYEMTSDGVVSRSSGVSRLTGFSPEEIQPTLEWWHARVHPDDLELALKVAERADADFRTEYRILHRDGHILHVWDQGTILRDASGTMIGCIGFTLDISERKKLEAQYLEAKNTAEAASRAKDQFIATLSHELRTPLTPAILHTQILLEDEEISDFTRLSLETIHRNIELEARLIDDLLDVTRIARGKMHLELREVNLHDLIRHASSLCEAELQAAGHKLVLDFRATRVSRQADPARFEQVIWNLLKNAIKFTPEAGTITISTYNTTTSIAIEVCDTGIGIESQFLERIFNPFEQGALESQAHKGGLGLGLAIACNIISMHEGSINATSQGLGKGSTFRIELAV